MRRQFNDICGQETARNTGTLALFVLLGVIGFAPPSSGAERVHSYVALKGGIYSPSEEFTLTNLDLETTFDSDTKTGVAGEIAVGHYVLPTLALELGVGYFKGAGTVAADSVSPSHDVDFDVIPLVLSAKALIPVGSVDPYAEAGIGAYFTKFDVSDNANTFESTTTFGMHAGAGLNVNISPSTFIGVEARYVWAEPSIGGERIVLNDTEYSLDGFKLNGFTTMLGVGIGF